MTLDFVREQRGVPCPLQAWLPEAYLKLEDDVSLHRGPYAGVVASLSPGLRQRMRVPITADRPLEPLGIVVRVTRLRQMHESWPSGWD